MTLVLCDGAPSSMKALDLGVVPGFLTDHDKEQLVLIHGWKDSKDPAQLAPVAAVVDSISKSRVASTTLNYKLEMTKLPNGTTDHNRPISTTPHINPGGAASPGPANAKAATEGKGKGAPVAGKEEPPAAPVVSAEESQAAEKAHKEECAKHLINYAAKRCEHHQIKNIVLGVGNTQQGKSLGVGSVAKEVLSHFGKSHNLFFMKPTGPAVRPTAALRMMVLVIPGTSLKHLHYALSLCNVEKKNDRLGVTIVVNNGKPKAQQQELLTLQTTDAEGVVSVPEVARRCTSILAEHGLHDSAGNDDAASVAQESFALLNYLTLEPTKELQAPTVDDTPMQVIKYVGSMKVDFLVLPTNEGLSDNFFSMALAAPKPHLFCVA